MLMRYHRRIEQLAPQLDLGPGPAHPGLAAAAKEAEATEAMQATEATGAPRPRQWQVPAAWGASMAQAAIASAAAATPLEGRPGVPRQGAVEHGEP